MKGEYVPTIGLEIHAELKTQTKMFCNSKNDANEKRPNVNICPVCMAHPGTLPVINRQAVKYVLQVGLALRGKLADYTEFDRKNYFYPDLPKGYQLSQFEYPLVSGGSLSNVAITRVHLEEDTASSIHDEENGDTLIDYNRAGVPLMELVTEPVIHSAEQAGKFARELQLLLRYLDVSDANMEKGEMRVEANISVARSPRSDLKNHGPLGTKVEVKNLNSFRAMERAVAYEIRRQTEILNNGDTVIQQTRGWDESKQATFPQRAKEGSADYRYFPDPDLPSLKLSEIQELRTDLLREVMPELPSERRARYTKLGIKAEDADQYVTNTSLGRFFDAVVSELNDDAKAIVLSSNYIANDLASLTRDIDERDMDKQGIIAISAQNFAKLIALVSAGKVSSRGAKDILAEMLKTDTDPEKITRDRGLFQKGDVTDIKPIVIQLLKDNAGVVADYRNGKGAALSFLIGQGMKATKGSANPTVLREVILEYIQGPTLESGS